MAEAQEKHDTEITAMLRALARDIEVLSLARAALYADPRSAQTAPSFSRLLVTATINTFEAAFKALGTDHPVAHYYTDKGLDNRERAEKMHAAFEETTGLRAEISVFEDLFFLKMLRNVYSHGQWKDKDRDAARQLGLSSSLERFTYPPPDDWERTREICLRAIPYLMTLAGQPALELLVQTPSDKRADATKAYAERLSAGHHATSVAKAIDLLSMSLEAEPSPIDFWFDPAAPARAALRLLGAADVAFTEGRRLVRHPKLAGYVLGAWATLEAELPTTGEVTDALTVFASLRDRGVLPRFPLGFTSFPREHGDALRRIVPESDRLNRLLDVTERNAGKMFGPWDPRTPDDVASAVLSAALPSEDSSVVQAAFRAAYKCYQLLPDPSVPRVLAELLKIAGNDEHVRRAASRAEAGFRAARAWYDYVEGPTAPLPAGA